MQVLGYTSRTDGFIVMVTWLSGGFLQCRSRQLVKYKIACAKTTYNGMLFLIQFGMANYLYGCILILFSISHFYLSWMLPETTSLLRNLFISFILVHLFYLKSSQIFPHQYSQHLFHVAIRITHLEGQPPFITQHQVSRTMCSNLLNYKGLIWICFIAVCPSSWPLWICFIG